LLDGIGRRGGVNLDRMYTDYFTGDALPRLTLRDVAFSRVAKGWAVHGSLENRGTGESFAPVVLRTAAGSIRQTVRVDSHGATPFVFETDYEPRTLQLDPEKVSYRFGIIGTIDSVDYGAKQ
jgi:hypothetical protein